MGTRYFMTLPCPHCQEINYDVYYAPTCDSTTWQCKYCHNKFDIEEQFSQEELAEYTEEAESDSEMIKNLIASFQEPATPQLTISSISPVISQLAIAIEETLIVYHEPHFIRWACRSLQGIVDKNFNPAEYASDHEVCTWAGVAATECVNASKQPILNDLIADAVTAVECALRAQDVIARDVIARDAMTSKDNNIGCADAQKEK